MVDRILRMRLEVHRAELDEILPMRALFREEAHRQIVRDSILPRGLADPWVFLRGGSPVGYAGVWNEHFPGRVMEFFVTGELEGEAGSLLRRLIRLSGAVEMEAQTNLARMFALLGSCTRSIAEEDLLFEDGGETTLTLHGGLFRPRGERGGGPDGEWVIELEGEIVAAGGVLTHYNPPYADLYMEVASHARGKGIGSYLVQELRRVCRAAGLIPAARCAVGNEASRRTLTRGGMVRCGALCAGPTDV